MSGLEMIITGVVIVGFVYAVHKLRKRGDSGGSGGGGGGTPPGDGNIGDDQEK